MRKYLKEACFFFSIQVQPQSGLDTQGSNIIASLGFPTIPIWGKLAACNNTASCSIVRLKPPVQKGIRLYHSPVPKDSGSVVSLTAASATRWNEVSF